MKTTLNKVMLKRYICFFVTIIYALSLLYMYRKQANLENGLTDLPAHIQAGLSNNACYSLVYLILGFLWKLPYHSVMISLFLTLLTMLSIFVTFKLLKYLLPSLKNTDLYLASLICNMYMPLFVPFFNDGRYLGLLSFILYHNSTYMAMSPFAIFSVLVFLKLREKYNIEKITIKEWIVFATLMLITTWFKPNFMFGFAPCMLIVMIIDFIKGHGKRFLNYIIFGTTVLPTILLMIWQQTQLFDSSSGLGFSFFKVWSAYSRHPIVAILQSLAFPIVVLVFNYKDLLKDKAFSFAWLFVIFNISIYAFMHENGLRQFHGNLGWGASFAVGVIFIISMYKFISTINNKNLTYSITVSCVLGMHFLCWVNFYLGNLSLFGIKESLVRFLINI